jgi:hypothetical protein
MSRDVVLRYPSIMRKGISTLIVTFFIFISLAPMNSASASAPRSLADSNLISGWILGQDISNYSCWDSLSKSQMPVLQIKIGNNWITKSKGRISQSPKDCKDRKFPVEVTYHWKASISLAALKPYSDYHSINAREIIPATKSAKLISTPPFNQVVYLSVDESLVPLKSVLDGFLAMLGPRYPSPSPSSLSDLKQISSNCTFRGKFLGGRVKIVDIGADFNVKIVPIGEDLNVREVSIGNGCGIWQIVDIGQDFSIKLVDIGQDFSIKLVDIGAGLP